MTMTVLTWRNRGFYPGLLPLLAVLYRNLKETYASFSRFFLCFSVLYSFFCMETVLKVKKAHRKHRP